MLWFYEFGERSICLNSMWLIEEERGCDMSDMREPQSVEVEPNSSWLILCESRML